MHLDTPEDAMPWVGLYVCAASLVCTLAMAADTFQGFRQGKLWFPCRFFSLNAASITVIAIAMKLPVDLTTIKPNDDGIESKSGDLLYSRAYNNRTWARSRSLCSKPYHWLVRICFTTNNTAETR
ncbi:hypothetical protein Tco_0463640, partial [Tanacetum coccineum]